MLKFAHAVYGVRLHCNRRIVELRPDRSGLDAELCLRLDFKDSLASSHPTAEALWVPPGVHCRVREAPTLTLQVESALTEGETVELICSSMLPALIPRLGALVLRGSAVLGPSGALLLIGGAMAGKSTAAAALACQGWPLISDDVLVLGLRDGQLRVAAGVPWIKLWPQGGHLGAALGELRGAVRPGLAKQRYACANAADLRGAPHFPVARVCLLAPQERNQVSIEPISVMPLLSALADFQRSPAVAIDAATKIVQFRTLGALSRLPAAAVIRRPDAHPLSADYGLQLRNLIIGGALE